MSPTKQRTILMYTIGILFLLGVVWIIFSYATSANLTLVTDDASNEFTLVQMSPTRQNIKINQSGKVTNLRVGAGSYLIKLASKAGSTSEQITVKAGDSKTVTLNITSSASITNPPQVVTSLGAADLIAGQSGLMFIDRNNAERHLYAVDQANHVTLIDPVHTYQNIEWADQSFGIGLATKGTINANVVKIENQKVTEVPLPFTYNEDFTFAVAPNHTWYVSDGKVVYRANGDGSFTKIFSPNDEVGISTASNDAVAIKVGEEGSGREEGVAVIHLDGTKYQLEGEIYESAWSPSGKRVVTSGGINKVFDDKLNAIADLPENNVVSPVWLNENTLLYTRGGDIWRFDLTSKRATLLTSINKVVGSVSDLTPDESGDYLYFSIYRNGYSNPTFGLNRVSLGNKPVSDTSVVGRLNIALPYTDSGCSINFMNFTTISILYKSLSSRENCVTVAKDTIVFSKALDRNTVDSFNYQALP